MKIVDKQIIETVNTEVENRFYDINQMWENFFHILGKNDEGSLENEQLPKYVKALVLPVKGNIDHNLNTSYITQTSQEDFTKIEKVLGKATQYITYTDVTNSLWENPKEFHEAVYIRGGFCVIDGKTMRLATDKGKDWKSAKAILQRQLETGPSVNHILEAVVPLQTSYGTPYHVISLEDSLFAQYIVRLKTQDMTMTIAESVELLQKDEPEIWKNLKQASLRSIKGIKNRYRMLYGQNPQENRIQGVLWSSTLSVEKSIEALYNTPLITDKKIHSIIQKIKNDKENLILWKQLWKQFVFSYNARYEKWKNSSSKKRDPIMETLRALFLTHWPAVYTSKDTHTILSQETWPLLREEIIEIEYTSLVEHLLLRVHDDIAMQSALWAINTLHVVLKNDLEYKTEWNFDPSYLKLHVDTTYGHPNLSSMFARWIGHATNKRKILIAKPADHVVIHHSAFAKGALRSLFLASTALKKIYEKDPLFLISSVQPLSANGDFAADDTATTDDFNHSNITESNQPAWVENSYINPSPLSRNGLILYALNFAIHDRVLQILIENIVEKDRERLKKMADNERYSFQEIERMPMSTLTKELQSFFYTLATDLKNVDKISHSISLRKIKRYFGSLMQISFALKNSEIHTLLELLIVESNMKDGSLQQIMSDKNTNEEWIRIFTKINNHLTDPKLVKQETLQIMAKLFLSRISDNIRVDLEKDFIFRMRKKIVKSEKNQKFADEMISLLEAIEIEVRKHSYTLLIN